MQPLLEAQHLKTTIQHLEFGDFAFSGNGPEGPIMIGIERKRVRDLLSSLRTGRFAGHQLPGLLRVYDWCYLFVEGILRANPESGILEEAVYHAWKPVRLGESGFAYRDLDAHLTTLECRAGACFRIRRTDFEDASAITIANLWHYWNDKEWDEHRSHLSLNLTAEYGWIVRPGLLRRMVSQLDDVGWERSSSIAQHFGSEVKTVREALIKMAGAEEKDWLIPGVIGKILSRRIVAALKEEIREQKEDRSG